MRFKITIDADRSFFGEPEVDMQAARSWHGALNQPLRDSDMAEIVEWVESVVRKFDDGSIRR